MGSAELKRGDSVLFRLLVLNGNSQLRLLLAVAAAMLFFLATFICTFGKLPRRLCPALACRCSIKPFTSMMAFSTRALVKKSPLTWENEPAPFVITLLLREEDGDRDLVASVNGSGKIAGGEVAVEDRESD